MAGWYRHDAARCHECNGEKPNLLRLALELRERAGGETSSGPPGLAAGLRIGIADCTAAGGWDQICTAAGVPHAPTDFPHLSAFPPASFPAGENADEAPPPPPLPPAVLLTGRSTNGGRRLQLHKSLAIISNALTAIASAHVAAESEVPEGADSAGAGDDNNEGAADDEGERTGDEGAGEDQGDTSFSGRAKTTKSEYMPPRPVPPSATGMGGRSGGSSGASFQAIRG